jgi:hypothetical protein
MGNHKIIAKADRRALSLSNFLRDCLYLILHQILQLIRAHSHKEISSQKCALRRVGEGAHQSKSPCCICPSYKHFPPTPCYVHRVHPKPPVHI